LPSLAVLDHYACIAAGNDLKRAGREGYSHLCSLAHFIRGALIPIRVGTGRQPRAHAYGTAMAEQALSWSGLPVVTVRPTVFLEGFFLQLAAPGVRASDELALPLGSGKTSPISAVDVARAVAVILDDPAPHIGQIYDLTGPEPVDLDHYAGVFSEALGRPIRYRDVPLPASSESLRQAKFPEHLVRHLSAMAELTKQGRYDRMTDTMRSVTGEAPTNLREFVKLHAAEFNQRGPAHS
jgi:uncharacterized protein YbjT (DUF2867 family)